MVPDGDTQSLLHLSAAGDVLQHCRVEQGRGIASRSFCDIEGHICVFRELLRIDNMFRRGNANAGSDFDLSALDRHWLAYDRHKFLRSRKGRLQRAILYQYGKFIAANAGGHIGWEFPAKTVTDLNQHHIAAVMPEQIIGLFETIKIDGKCGVSDFGCCPRRGELLNKL